MTKTKSYSSLRRQEFRLLDRIDEDANARVKAIHDEIWRRKYSINGDNEKRKQYNVWLKGRHAEQRAIKDKAESDKFRVAKAFMRVARNMEKSVNSRSEETRTRFMESGKRIQDIRFTALERQTGVAASAALAVG